LINRVVTYPPEAVELLSYLRSIDGLRRRPKRSLWKSRPTARAAVSIQTATAWASTHIGLPGTEYEVLGIPKDEFSARAMAYRHPHQFKVWAVSRLGELCEESALTAATANSPP
jgi:hypothetical protein